MIEHWRISAVYFTCNQVYEKVKSSRKGDCHIFRLLKIGGTRSANLPLLPEHRPNFASENEWCVDARLQCSSS